MELIAIQELAHKLWIHGLHTENKEWAEIELIAYPSKEQQIKTKICEECGKEFTPNNSAMLSCSSECRKKRAKLKRKVKASICKRCGDEYPPRKGRKHCPACLANSYLVKTTRVFR